MAEAEEPGIGPYLARQRRLRGITLEDLSARTKIPLRSLERLESGAFDREPDGFSRSFVRAVAAALGLDADDAVMRLLSEPADDEPSDLRALRLRQLTAAAAALLLASALAAGVWLLVGLATSEPTGEQAPVVFRRDAVRDLAAEPRPDVGGAGVDRSLDSAGAVDPD